MVPKEVLLEDLEVVVSLFFGSLLMALAVHRLNFLQYSHFHHFHLFVSKIKIIMLTIHSMNNYVE